MTFLEKIYNLMQPMNIKKSQLCTELGINQNSFVNWENRGTLPSGDIIIKLAQFFNVSTDYLLGLTEEQQSLSPELSEDKQRLLKMYDLLNDLEKAEILGELKGMTRGRAESKNAETA